MSARPRVVPVVIVGARGRMGTALVREVLGSEDLALVGAVDRSEAPGLGQDIGRLAGLHECGVALGEVLSPPKGSVVVDFSLPLATALNVRRCADAGAALVCGTTGVDLDTEELMRSAAREIPIVYAANFSVGVTLLNRLAAIAAYALGTSWEAEIFEVHHRHKRDAPSGTALRLAHEVASATERRLGEVCVTDRSERQSARSPEEIGVVAARGGDVVGEHTLMFLGDGERIELVHRATDRAIFARGALRAARWVCDRAPGLYDMTDVLGLDDEPVERTAG